MACTGVARWTGVLQQCGHGELRYSWAGKAPFFSSSGKQLLEDRGAPPLISLFLEVHGQE
jgi:hypothetical protein